MITEPDRIKKRTKRRKRKGLHQELSSYLSFGFYSISCLALFAISYSMMLLILVPLLAKNSSSIALEESLHGAPDSVVEAVEVAARLRKKWKELATITDSSLLEETIREYKARKDFLKHLH